MLANHTTDFSGDKILPPRSLLTPQAGSPWNGRLCATGKWAELGGAGPFLHRGWLGAAPSTFLASFGPPQPASSPPSSCSTGHVSQWHSLERHTSVSRWSEVHSCRGSGQSPSDLPSGRALGASRLSQAGCEGGPCPQGRVYPSSLIPLHAQEAVLIPPEDRGLGRWEGKCRGGDW